MPSFRSNKLHRREFLKYCLAGLVSAPLRVYAEKDAGEVYYVFAQHQDYELYRQVFNNRIKLKPLVIAVCFSEQGVVQAVNYARDNNLAVSIKSGGHSFEGFSLNSGGMVIDLSNMSRIQLEGDTAVIEPGCKLAAVYDHILPRKRIIPMGSCGGVGIAGLTLGGGYGLFSREYGLTCDSLRAVRLINGKGELVTSDDDKDLLWASRGGGNGNFGIVTRFEFKTQPSPEYLHAKKLHFYKLNEKRLKAISREWFDASAALPNDAFSAFVLNGRRLMILVTWLSSPGEVNQAWKNLIKLADKVYPDRSKPMEKAVKRYYGIMYPIYFKNASAGYYKHGSELNKVMGKIFSEVKNTKGLIFQINTLGGKISDPSLEPTAAYAHRNYSYLGEVQAYWDKPAQQAKSIAAVDRVQQQLYLNGIRAHYCNYPDLNFKNWQSAYYGQSYARLQAFKNKHDPENIIRHPQSVLPG